ncbi:MULTISPECIES: hypothetical protein [Flavobacterium]|uniref:Uncharacterized protein n=1 Tax=Flavobacterium piscis TaxID=1114874 RepID=A0ABU1YCH0_9FLAO|nr:MULTISPECIES: hypothetical protein [Flavobacterium]MDR7211942.1 hypothetical protein [Flavobacterium piscis]OOV17662.1 hypothetical protein BXU10_16495 [Flavobacterium sp. LM4]
MELNKIKIATGNPTIVKNIIEDFNKRYQTNFSIESIEDWDGVEFVIVNVNSSSLDDIYLLGFFHGMEIQDLRQKGEIDY